MKNILLFLGMISLLMVGCKDDEVLPVDDIYAFHQPEHFPEVAYPMNTNKINKQGFELGKKLFNDPRLSIDNSVACSNCHVKGVGFTDPQHNPSVGVFERPGTRNSLPVFNLAFQKEFMWDGGISHLDFVPVFAIENENEMAETLINVVQKLNAIDEYPALFKAAFPEIDTITSPYMLKALSQYMLLIVSDNAKYDKVLRGEQTFTLAEQQGEAVFNAKCASCHSGTLFTNQEFKNNGLDTEFVDIGRALITETDEDLGKFKTPTLRNITLTAPYMHDGRFTTLDEVINHYRFGVKNSATLATELNINGELGISMTDEEVESLKLFLETLTDYEFISNPIF